MVMQQVSDQEEKPDIVEYTIVVGMLCSLDQGVYQVGRHEVAVSYPQAIPFGYPVGSQRLLEELPKEVSTVFRVRWPDNGGKTKAQLKSGNFQIHLPLQKAFDAINQLLTAYKLVRVGHAEGITLRTVGVADTILCECFVGNDGPYIVNRRLHGQGGPKASTRKETNELARPHIASDSFPVARRFLKCFELFERGYFNESTVLAHGILDDIAQHTLRTHIAAKGLSEAEATELLRAVKESRLRLYLGPILKVVTGKTVSDLWPHAFDALNYLNDRRNDIAHNGFNCTKSQAAHCLFTATALASALDVMKLADVKFPEGMLRTARVESAWTLDRPRWAPTPGQEELEPWETDR